MASMGTKELEAELERLAQENAKRIAELKKLTATEVIARQRNTLPPPEVMRSKQQQHKMKLELENRGSIVNLKRDLRNNAILLFLLIAAITLSTVWILKMLEMI